MRRRSSGTGGAPSLALTLLLLCLPAPWPCRVASFRTRAPAARRTAPASARGPGRLGGHAPAYGAADVVELQYSEFTPPSGAACGPPVIFLHGLLGNKRNFASLASSLCTQLRTPRTVYTVDLRNHGDNTHDWRPTMSYSEMARDVLAFLDRRTADAGGAGDGRAVLVGHSMGGKVAQSLALMHPARVAGLVVLDIAPVRYGAERGDNEGDASGWRAVEDIVRAVARVDLAREGYATKRDVDAALRRGPLEDPALRAFVLTNLEQRRTTAEDAAPLRWKIHWQGIVRELDRIAGFDVHDRPMDDAAAAYDAADDDAADRTRPPRAAGPYSYDGDAFFIHGGASRFVRHAHIATIAAYFPNHMLTTIRGVGHWVHAEAPDDTIALLKRYLDR